MINEKITSKKTKFNANITFVSDSFEILDEHIDKKNWEY